MGFYNGVLIYIGRLLSEDAYNRIKHIIPLDWITDMHDSRNLYIIHPPNGIIYINNNLDNNLSYNDIYKYINNTYIKKVYNNDQLIKKLKTYIKLASKNNNDENYYLYYLEYSWSTLENIRDSHIQKNIRIF